jgi:cytochrome c oxidase subunit II
MVTGWPHMSNPADDAFFFILGISVVLLALNTGVMLYFVFRYRKKRHPRAEEVAENVPLEILWTVIPTILVLAIFFVGWKGFQYMRTAPPDAMIVKAMARQWSWTFTYENGKQSNVLHVPLRKPVKLLITSADVLHSLYIPAYRIKEDAVPGRETHLWFLPDEPGSYDLFCTEYCGVGHSAMITTVEVMNQKEFDAWYAGTPNQAAPRSDNHPHREKTSRTTDRRMSTSTNKPGRAGEELVQVKGCVACHSLDGTPKIGPTLKGVFNKKETIIKDGREQQVTVDEEFIRRKLPRPETDRIKGYPPIMPPQQVTGKESEEIIEYLKTLK